jgi:hypothetical protein
VKAFWNTVLPSEFFWFIGDYDPESQAFMRSGDLHQAQLQQQKTSRVGIATWKLT